MKNKEKFFINILLIGMIILISFNLNIFTGNSNLDFSWQNAYNYFYQYNMQYGKDIIFTYGPLGSFLIGGVNNGTLFFMNVVCQCVMYICLYSIIYYMIKKYNFKIGLLFLLTFICVPVFKIDYYYYFIELICFYLLLDVKISYRKIIIYTILLSILSSYKFTFFLLSIGSIGIISFYLILNKKIKLLSNIIFLFIIEHLLIWIITGQKLENFIVYIINYFNLSATYYQYAMDLEYIRHGYWYVAIAIIISLFLLYNIIDLVIKNKFKRLLKNKDIYVWSLILFFNWSLFKYGFGRHDFHQEQYWVYTIFASIFILCIMKYSLDIKRKVSFIVIIVISGILMIFPRYDYNPNYSLLNKNIINIKENIEYLTLQKTIFDKKEELLSKYEIEKQKNKLPQIASIVKNDTVDIYNFQQNYILFNDLNWKPRPVFQSYLAHYKYLLDKNYQFIETTPPQYILFKVQDIDSRLSLMADNLWIRDVLYNYDYITQEQDILLLKQKSKWNDINNNIEKIGSKNSKFGEIISLNDEDMFVTININYSVLGKFIGFLYKTPTIWIEIELETGEKVERRIIPEMVKTPIYIKNLIDNNQDLLEVMSGNIKHKKVKSIKIKEVRNQEIFFKNEINMVFYKAYNLNKWNIN